MTRNYKDYTIKVNEIEHPNYGRGFRAEFYIAKNSGLKANVKAYETYDRNKKHGQVVEEVQKIIDQI